MLQERLIGRVVVVWAKLEGMLNDLIWAIQGKAMADGKKRHRKNANYAPDQNSKKSSERHSYPKGLSEESAQTTALLDEIDNIKNQRNLIVHGTWGQLDGVAAVKSLTQKPMRGQGR